MASSPHQDAIDLLELQDELGVPDLDEMTPQAARAMQREVSLPGDDLEPVGSVRNRVVRGHGHGVPVRVYTPEGDGPFPVLVWAHGGGWVLGDIDTEDPTGRALANAGECVVVSVDYRMSPEHRFPAALHDVNDVVGWVAETSPERDDWAETLMVGGSSAGGALAAGTTLLSRDRDGPAIDHQLLVYPAVNYTRDLDSYTEHDDYFLLRKEMDWFIEQYLADPLHGHNPYAFPMEAEDLSGLPPATVVTAEFDLLRDDGIGYAERLEAAGVPVTHHHYDDMIHAFFGMLDDPEWDRAREAVADVGEALRAV